MLYNCVKTIFLPAMWVFPPVLTGCFSQKFEWQQFSSGLQDFSKYPNSSLKYCGWDSLDSSADRQFLRFLSLAFEKLSKGSNYNYYYSLQVFHTSVSWWSFTGA